MISLFRKRAIFRNELPRRKRRGIQPEGNLKEGLREFKQKKRINLLNVAMKEVVAIIERLKLDPNISEKTKETQQELIVHLPVKMDDKSKNIRILLLMDTGW